MQIPTFLAILPYTRNTKLFSGLLAFLTIFSIVIWLIVVLSTFVRFGLCSSLYRPPKIRPPE